MSTIPGNASKICTTSMELNHILACYAGLLLAYSQSPLLDAASNYLRGLTVYRLIVDITLRQDDPNPRSYRLHCRL